MRFFTRWPFTLLIALTTILLSAAGAYGMGDEGRWMSPIDWLIGTISLFKMTWGWPFGFHLPWPIQAARFTGAFFTISALSKVWMKFFGEQVTRFRLSHWTRHVVICGLGRKGQRLAFEGRRRKMRVVLADVAPEEDDARLCRNERILIETGDATKDATLEAVGVERARYVFAVCSEDHTNLEIGMETLARFVAKRQQGPLSCYIHLIDLPLRVLLQRHELFKKWPPGFDLRFFNIYENTARALFAAFPPEAGLRSAAERVHLIVVGLTHLGEAIATQAARIGHYRDLRPVRLTIIDEQAEARGEEFLTRQPGLREACEIEFLQMRLTEPRFTMMEFLEPASPQERQTVVFCLEQDEPNISMALTLAERTHGKIPLLANVAEQRGLAKLLSASKGELQRKGIQFFGAVEEVCGWDLLREERLDILAKTFAKFYETRNGGPKWEDLREDLRNSNRAAADHIDVKLRAIGRRRAPANGSEEQAAFTPEEVELLSRMEHERWSADRLLSGWVFGQPRDNERKIHDNLVPWDKLSEPDREKDREQVRDLPAVLATAGIAIHRERTTNTPASTPCVYESR